MKGRIVSENHFSFQINHSLKPTKIQSFQLSFSNFPVILLFLLFFLVTKTSANSGNVLDLDKVNEQGIHVAYTGCIVNPCSDLKSAKLQKTCHHF